MDRRTSILGFLNDLTNELRVQGLATLNEEEIFDTVGCCVLRERIIEWKAKVDELTYKICEKWFEEVIELDTELRQW